MSKIPVPNDRPSKVNVPNDRPTKANVPNERKTVKISSKPSKEDMKGRPSVKNPQPGTKIDPTRKADGSLKRVPKAGIEERKKKFK